LGPYVPEPSKTWSFEDPILDPLADAETSAEEFQRQLALSHLKSILHPKMAAAVQRGAGSVLGSVLGLGPLGPKAVGKLPKPRFTDPEALYLQSITEAAQEDIDWMGGRHHEAAPPLASEIEAYQTLQAAQAIPEYAQAVQAAAGQAATMTQDQFPLVSGVDFDPGQAAPSFDPEVALALEALGL
jgi:hypothetical protein